MENPTTQLGLAVWNYKITTLLKACLYIQTNNGIVPCAKVNQKINQAIELLEDFEQQKQATIIHQLSKHAQVCKKEAEELTAQPWYKFWLVYRRAERLKILWCSYSVYQNAMAIVLDTLPSDIQIIIKEQPAPNQQQQQSSTVTPDDARASPANHPAVSTLLSDTHTPGTPSQGSETPSQDQQ